MAKVRIEYVRLLRGGGAGVANPEIIVLTAGGAVEVDVGSVSVLAPPAPTFPDGIWQSGVYARVFVLAGAVVAEKGDNTVLADSAGGNLIVQGGQAFLPIEAGQFVAMIEAAFTVAPGFVAAPPPVALTATITSGTDLSDAIQVDGKLVGIIVPAAWTAAGLSFRASLDGVGYFDVYDAGVERTIASGSVVAARFLSQQLSDWLGVKFIKVRSGTAATPVAQAADRAIKLVVAG